MICVSIRPNSYEKLTHQLLAAIDAADLIEIRLDSLPLLDYSLLGTVVRDNPKPILFTLRSREQGGAWQGSEAETRKQLVALAQAEPAYLDVEYPASEELVEALRRASPSTRLLLSHHDFAAMPASLDTLLVEMRRCRCDLYKIAVTVDTTADSLRLLLFSRAAGDDVLTIGMGNMGEVTRVVGPLVGNPWTYASLSQEETTAPGQLDVGILRECYHYSRLGPETKFCALLGDPITYSNGHIVHNAVFRALDIDAIYVRLPVCVDEIEEVLHLLTKLGTTGCSVTLPIKEVVQPCLVQIQEEAAAIGAVNTLTFGPKGILGGNTDAAGALDALESHQEVKGRRVAIIGAGGAARAVAYEAKRRGASVGVFARRVEQATQVAVDLGVEGFPLSRLAEDSYHVLVNSTPASMPVEPSWIHGGVVAMDLKSRPQWTAFLREAIQRGCRCVCGWEMFAYQAVGQVRSWFGTDYPEEQLYRLYRKECEALLGVADG